MRRTNGVLFKLLKKWGNQVKPQGYLKLHRSLVHHRIYDDPTAAFLFVTLLMLVDRDSGSYDSGRFVLAKKVGMKPMTCYKALKRLERETMVKLTVNARYTQITVVNWQLWQSSVNARETQSNTKQEARSNISTNVDTSTSVDIKQIFYDLVNTLGFSDKTILTDQRRAKLKARLKRFSAKQLTQAAEAIAASPFHQGDNPQSKRYGTIDFLLRGDEKVDEWLNSDNKKVTYKADW